MTNQIVLRTIQEFMTGYKPAYIPLLPLFIGGNSQQYAVEAGKVTFQRLEAIGDLRSKMLGPKDTEIHQIHAKAGSKEFKKYFFGSQFIQSELQDRQGYEDVVAQALDEHNKQADELFLLGEGTGTGNVVNNGLYWSADANYTLKSSYEVQKDSNGNYLLDLYAVMTSLLADASAIDGRLLVLSYGTTFLPVYNGLFPSTANPFTKVISDANDNVEFAKLPAAITPSGANGFIIVNLDQVKTHYTLLPTIKNQGINEEKLYAWTNFLMGSSMLEVLTSGAVVRQPITLEA